MQSTKSLFDKIKLRIRSNPVFSANIHYPFSQHVKGTPSIWVNQDDDRVYLCVQKYLSLNCTFINFNVVDAFLQHYSFRQILEVPESEFRHHKEFKYHRVIYEIQENNFS